MTCRPRADASAFAELGLESSLVQALGLEGYSTPTPIQRRAIPLVLQGGDLVACAQTGTGKTAAFVLPLLQRLASARGRPRALVLTPTRELALQIGERACAYGKQRGLGQAVLYGGVSQRRQERDLARRPDLLIATPGRLLDLMRQQLVSLEELQILVLDEADTMLDMGFVHDIRRVVAQVPAQRQTLLFSATMPASIAALVREVTQNPRHVSVDRQATPAEKVDQSVYFVGHKDKRQLLQRLLSAAALERVLVFTRTKHGANRLAQQLSRAGIGATAIHGNKSQSARETALGNFKLGRTPVLVATDVAARGIDVPHVALVVNYELPNVPESYVHRIGRTGRAGASGRAVSFCAHEEQGLLRDIERLIRRRIEVADDEWREGVPSPARPLDTGKVETMSSRPRRFEPVEGNRASGSAGRRFRRRPGRARRAETQRVGAPGR